MEAAGGFVKEIWLVSGWAIIIHLLAYEDGTDSVPKGRYIKFRARGITQKKTYNIEYTTKG